PKAGLLPKHDDWSSLQSLAAEVAMDGSDAAMDGSAPIEAPAVNGAEKQDDDPANAGLRREPGLEPHKDIAPEKDPASVNEFDPDADEPERESANNRALARNMRQMARRIAMDPGD